ncbi:MAG: HNH endonuclease family protein, partial [Cyanobacteria bacterium J06623_5]
GDKHPGSLRYSSKLFLNANNDNFYQGNLINLREPNSLRKLRPSNRLLWQAFNYFSNQLDTLGDIIDDGLFLSNFITETIAKKLLFIEITVEDDVNAYTVFETLNSRGVELSATDLLKNYIFSKFTSEDDLISGQREWQEITRTVGMNKFPEFLKYFLSMTRSRVRNKDLFKLTKKKVSNAEQAFDLLAQLNKFSELYVALGNPNDSFWLDFDNVRAIRSSIDELILFRTKQAYPVLFSAYKAFSKQNFERLLKIVTVISFRYISVSGLNPNDLEKQYNSLANRISDGKVKSPKAAFNVISSLYIKDEKFRQDFASMTLTDKKKKLLQYILQSLEKDKSGKGVTIDDFSIEHVLPQNPDEGWFQYFRDDEIDEAIYRLGNITPLEQSSNARLGTKPYEEKKKVYQSSSYEITKNIVADEWTMSAIVNRQERMADRATHIWRIGYA